MEVRWTVIVTSLCACTLSYSSHVQLFATPWTIALQAPLSMGFSRQQYWMGCHALLQGIFLAKGGTHISCLLHWQVGSLPLVPPRKPNILTLSMKYQFKIECDKMNINSHFKKKKKKGRITDKKPKKEIKCYLKKYLINLRDRSKKKGKGNKTWQMENKWQQ